MSFFACLFFVALGFGLGMKFGDDAKEGLRDLGIWFFDLIDRAGERIKGWF